MYVFSRIHSVIVIGCFFFVLLPSLQFPLEKEFNSRSLIRRYGLLLVLLLGDRLVFITPTVDDDDDNGDVVRRQGLTELNGPVRLLTVSNCVKWVNNKFYEFSNDALRCAALVSFDFSQSTFLCSLFSPGHKNIIARQSSKENRNRLWKIGIKIQFK